MTTLNKQRLFHGGIPGLRIGDLITPGHSRPVHPGCPWCAAREAQHHGAPAPHIDPLPAQPDRAYATTSRLYALHYASLYGYGDLYQVEPIGPTQRSEEDTIETWSALAFKIVAILERAVQLTMHQRHTLLSEWERSDREWQETRGSRPLHEDD